MNPFMRAILPVLLMGALANVLYAQNKHIVRGVVLESTKKGDFSPVVGVNVYWLNTSVGTTTDTSGVFRIPYKPEYVKLVVSAIGYSSDTLTVKDQYEIKIILQSDDKTLQELEVTAERDATFTEYLSPIKTQVMSEKELFKAACCNLSESFETNPSVDVSFADAVTGIKQVQMLGLAGIYTQITSENLPSIRGLAGYTGLGFLPGTWIESIQVTKGIGSVANGYESIAGQINVEMRKPGSDKLFFNTYQNNYGRTEGNLNLAKPLGKKWGTALLLHYNNAWRNMDMNHDHFLDMPKGSQINLVNRWHYNNNQGLVAQFGVKALIDDRTGGQIGFNKDADRGSNSIYGLGINTKRYEGFGKIGYVFAKKKYQSIGLMANVISHKQDSYFGLTDYLGSNQSAYANLIYQSIISDTRHKFRTGFSYLYDNYDETFKQVQYARTERVAGGFFEYTFTPNEKFNLVLGMRADNHNLFGNFVTPRIHLRYQITPTTAVRASFGRGQRTANIFAENTSVFVSARQVMLMNNNAQGKAYGLNPEVAWNAGLNITRDFMLFGREGTINFDYYRTDFKNQVVVDMDANPQQVRFYNLSGASYSNSFQAEFNYEVVRKLRMRTAYRFYDVKTTYGEKLLQRPLVARHRAFINLEYEVRRWKFDYTLNWTGKKRIPNTASNPDEFRKNEYSPSFFMMNAQVTHTFSKKLDVYVGVENLADFRQTDLVNSSHHPFGPYFDASLVWGPVVGRMFYGGLRYRIK